jgi:hypothetical protein
MAISGGALEALLLVNEHLETELRQLHETVAGVSNTEQLETVH